MLDDGVERVVSLLESHGFRAQDPPVTIGPLDHEFPAILLGREQSLDLVVVVDSVAEPDEKRVHQKVRGLAHSLDVLRSKRSLTVVVVGPRLSPATERFLGGHARVLNAGPTTDNSNASRLYDSLAVLLPLTLPIATTNPGDRLANLARRPRRRERSAVVRSLVAAASNSADAVSAVLKREIERALEHHEGKS